MSNPASHSPFNHASPDGRSADRPPERFVSRAGYKLLAAFEAFGVSPAGRVCGDLGANVGGFTDCLLQHHATKVYAVDTGYGVLAWTLRKDPRVIVRERTNALHVSFPEPMDFLAIDVGWTRQEKILPHAGALLAREGGGDVITLIKPHYESKLAKKMRGVLTPEQSGAVLDDVKGQIAEMRIAGGGAWKICGVIKSPLEGQKGNTEFLAWLRLADNTPSEHP